MNRLVLAIALLAGSAGSAALAHQAPWGAKDVPVSHRDRVYAAEQFSNTLSVTDPADGKLLGVIKLGDPQPANFSPLYKGQVLVHGLGFSTDGKTLAAVSIGSNSVTWIDTATNTVKHTTYIGRSPHEAFFTPNGKEVWVTVRGEDYISVLDPVSYEEKARLKTPGGPGMTIFSPDGKYGYVCSSFNPDLVVFDVASHAIVGHVQQPSPFCPNISATADGTQVWFTLKDVGKTVAFNARPPFNILKVIDTGPITNHVNFAHTPKGQFAYVTVGGTNQVKVFSTTDFRQAATVPVGTLPHGVWPSGDGTRIYVGLENDDRLAAIDTATNTVIGTVPIGQAPQAIAYVPNAVPVGAGTANLQSLGKAGEAVHLTLAPRGRYTDQRQPVRPGADPDRPGFGHGVAAEACLCAGARRNSRRIWRARTSGQLYHQSGRLGNRERCRPDPAGHIRRSRLCAAMAGRGRRRRGRTGQCGPGSARLIDGRGVLRHRAADPGAAPVCAGVDPRSGAGGRPRSGQSRTGGRELEPPTRERRASMALCDPAQQARG